MTLNEGPIVLSNLVVDFVSYQVIKLLCMLKKVSVLDEMLIFFMSQVGRRN